MGENRLIMGAISQEKKEYDELTVSYFRQKGYNAYAIDKTGERYADVVALKGINMALVEVKSPKEERANRKYDDAKNLSPELNKKVGRYLEQTREKVFSLFQRGKSLEKLYAVSVASQMYRYLHEFNEKLDGYQKFTGPLTPLKPSRAQTFLVVPSENSSSALSAMKTIKEHGFIKDFRHEAWRDILVIEFKF